MPIILATQEAEIQIAVQSQPGQIVLKTYLKKILHKKKKKRGW
jgi:hypothetical protein